MPAVTSLLIIDPNADFMDEPSFHRRDGSPILPKLGVPGATADAKRLAAMIRRKPRAIGRIVVTLDSHNPIHVATPLFWMDARGDMPSEFTVIAVSDVENGFWTPRNPAHRPRTLAYVRKLHEDNRFLLTVWPRHCEIGSPGHAVQPDLFEALCEWTAVTGRNVIYVTKGSNPFTEHYSAVKAEVPDPTDPTTMLNGGMIRLLRECDEIAIAGWAKSHCVKATVEDVADEIGSEHIRKFMFLTDCSSPIPVAPDGTDFPAIAEKFQADMVKRGMRLSNSLDYLG